MGVQRQEPAEYFQVQEQEDPVEVRFDWFLVLLAFFGFLAFLAWLSMERR